MYLQKKSADILSFRISFITISNPRDRFNQQYQDQYGQKRLRNQMQGEVVRKRPFGKGEDEEDEEIEEEEPKAEVK